MREGNNLTLEFTPKQRAEMIQCFGGPFLDALPIRLADYAERWGLRNFKLIEYYSVNCLFFCYSDKYGGCVLKIFGCKYEWYIDEIRALRELKGKRRYVRAYECDEQGGALLLERIRPGTTLKREPSIDRRISVFADVWQNSHAVPRDQRLYKSYLKTTEEAAEKHKDPELRRAARMMTSVCGDLYDRYTTRLLLHGDLHGDNLLKDIGGNYKIIDPHARTGPPICDLGRYIANEFYDAATENRAAVTEYVISRLSESLKLPQTDITKAFFVDITLMACWEAENGAVNLDGVVYAENLLYDWRIEIRG